MFNVAILNIKKILKKIIKLIIVIIIVTMIFYMFSKMQINFGEITKIETSYISLISSNILIAKEITEVTKTIQIESLLASELVIFTKQEEELMISESLEELKEEEVLETTITEELKPVEEIQNIVTDEIEESIVTEVIEENNKTDTYTHIYGTVKIRNESKYELTEEMLTPNVDFNNKQDILIFHTHTCESYTATEKNNYVASGNFRTIDLNYSVAHVGEVLGNYLSQMGYNITHNKTYHDYPAYSGSYTRSYQTVNSLLSGDSWTELVIDLHRDALGSNSSYAPSVKIGDEIAAQLMFVMGTDAGGLNHPNWLNNFKLAIKIQEKANEMYPGLFKPIILRNSRYNQNLASGACIIEVGATGNTLEQCEVSMKYLAKILQEIL